MGMGPLMGEKAIEIHICIYCISGLVTADTVIGSFPSGMKTPFGKKDVERDAVFNRMVHAARIKVQLKQVQDGVAELAKMIEPIE